MENSAVVWILALLVLALAVPLGLFVVLRAPRRDRPVDALPSRWPLVARPVLNGTERRLYRLICDALPGHLVFAKLPLVRMCHPADPDPKQVRYWFRLLGSTHVSFAVCDGRGRVLAAVDLVSEQSPPSLRTQRVKAAVLHACGVRYLSCTGDTLPTQPTLRSLVPQPQAPTGTAVAAASAPLTAEPKLADSAADGADSEFDDSFFVPPNQRATGEPASENRASATRITH
jgi:hypothetical protein